MEKTQQLCSEEVTPPWLDSVSEWGLSLAPGGHSKNNEPGEKEM